MVAEIATRTMTYQQAITEALQIAMREDPTVILLGEDVADSAGGGVFHITEGLSTKHGDDRVRVRLRPRRSGRPGRRRRSVGRLGLPCHTGIIVVITNSVKRVI